jgi:D-alanine transaminase
VKVHLNGRLVDERDAHISVLDRGFLFGDGVYEVVRFFARHGVGLEAHAARLARSLALARIDAAGFALGGNGRALDAICASLLDANGLDDAIVYLQVTRGAARTRSHVPTETLAPTVFAMATAAPPLSTLVAPQEIAAVTAEDTRWSRCAIKTVSLMGNILHLLDASDAGASEAILHRGGLVGEGAYSNVAIVTDGVLATPPVDDDPPILHGTARADLLRAAQACGIRAEVRTATLAELASADEVMITSSSRFVSAVVRLDGRTVGDGHAGPVTRRLFAAMRDEIAASIGAAVASNA